MDRKYLGYPVCPAGPVDPVDPVILVYQVDLEFPVYPVVLECLELRLGPIYLHQSFLVYPVHPVRLVHLVFREYLAHL